MARSTDPFINELAGLTFEAVTEGHMTPDEVVLLMRAYLPERFRDEDDPRPAAVTHDQRLTAVVFTLADELEQLVDRADGDSISKAAVRAFAARMRRAT